MNTKNVSYYGVNKVASGKKIRDYMKAQKVTLEDVACALMLSTTIPVKAWRNGKYMPSLANAILLAEILKVSVSDLFVIDIN